MSETRSCGKSGTQKVYWPGKEPIVQCDEHARQIQAVGRVMGCYVTVEPYQGIQTCTQQVLMTPKK